MPLVEAIEKSIKQLKITSLDISFNEIADMYSNGELIINPDYQRTFRWSIEKQSRFIESLVLEMPIPSVYVIEIDDGRYELIDGLQRISSYLNFRGLLKGTSIDVDNDVTNNEGESDEDISEYDEYLEEIPNFNEPLKLMNCDIITELNDLTFENLPSVLKIRLKRSFIRMEVLRKGIDPSLKYHMFKRLNTGGEQLSPQEVRNCTIRLVDNRFINFINRLQTNLDFKNTISSISKEKLRKKYAEELILRYFAIKNDYTSFFHDVSPFLTNYMEKVALSDDDNSTIFNYDLEEAIFNNTFQILNRILGKEAFAAARSNTDTLSGFNVYHFEVISSGIESIYKEIHNGRISDEQLRDKIYMIKRDPSFKKLTTGGGKNSVSALAARHEFVINQLRELSHE
jgi:uncharacterized protein with ParB-like and HNH nuclease domain